MECVFCKIAHKEIAKKFIYEDELVMSFDDIHPSAPIHILIVTKEHIPSIAHLQENHSALIAKLIYIAKQIAEQKMLRGYKLVFNVGKEGGQVIDHLHLHLLGGWGSKENPDSYRV